MGMPNPISDHGSRKTGMGISPPELPFEVPASYFARTNLGRRGNQHVGYDRGKDFRGYLRLRVPLKSDLQFPFERLAVHVAHGFSLRDS